MAEKTAEVTMLHPVGHPTVHDAAKQVHLSVQTLQEYDKTMGQSLNGKDIAPASIKTDSSPTLSSLYGAELSVRALQITRRLSTSVYLNKSWQQEMNAITKTSHKKEKVHLQNTYKTEPDPEKKFCPEKVKKVIRETLELHLSGKRYNAIEGSRLSVIIASAIKDRVKTLDMPRYKVVVNVFVGQMSKQDVQVSSRCLWDTEDDNFATARFENSSLYAVATVYGVYFQ